MLRKLATGAAFLLLALPASAQQAGVRDLAFRFTPPAGATLGWRAVESESSALNAHRQSVRWSQRLTLAFGEPLPDGFPATLTVTGVAALAGKPDTLHYLLARAVENRPIEVIVDRGGFVREVKDWPAVQAVMIDAIGRLTEPSSARVVAAALRKLDPATGSNAVSRPLLLMSGAFALIFKIDGSRSTYEDWQGGSSYIFPGRDATTRLIGKDGNRIYAEWSLATDRAVAAKRIGGEVMSLLNAAGAADRSLAEAARRASALLATGGVDLREDSGFIYDVGKHLVTRFEHRLNIKVGDYSKEELVTVTLD